MAGTASSQRCLAAVARASTLSAEVSSLAGLRTHAVGQEQTLCQIYSGRSTFVSGVTRASPRAGNTSLLGLSRPRGSTGRSQGVPLEISQDWTALVG